MTFGDWLYLIGGSVVLATSLSAVALAAFGWEDPSIRRQLSFHISPTELSTFPTMVVLVPARHEEAVLAATLERLAQQPYDPLRIIAIVGHDDPTTRAVAEHAASAHPDRIEVVIDHHWPKSKPSALISGIEAAGNADLIAIVDAEDDVAEGFFALAAAEFAADPALDVLQGGVLLVNLSSSWFATRSAVEYYLWYSSRLPWQARHGVVPLGGNTCVFRSRTLRDVDLWDPSALTEDADLGIRLAAHGARIAVRFEEALATQEETPLGLRAFVRQRARWDQGFIQVLRKGAWRALPGRTRALAVFTLAAPLQQALTGVLIPAVMLTWGLTRRLPVDLVLFAFLSLFAELGALSFEVVAAARLRRLRGERARIRDALSLALGLIPYQLVLLGALVVAISRELRGERGWAKTEHVGAHRTAHAEEVLSEQVA